MFARMGVVFLPLCLYCVLPMLCLIKTQELEMHRMHRKYAQIEWGWMDILKPSISGYRSNQRFGGEACARDRWKGRRWGHRRGLCEGAGRGGARHSRISEEEQEAESHRRTLRGVNLQ